MAWDGEEYQQRFDALAAQGTDVHGEATFVHALAPTTVLDAGCGTGRVAVELARRGVRVVGVDGDDSMIATARRLAPDLEWVHHDLTTFDLGRRFDVVIECTGVGPLVYDCLTQTAPNAIVALTGISAARASMQTSFAALNKELVLTNEVVFGSVNAGRRHYGQAAEALAAADADWLARLITRRVPLAGWAEALQRTDGDVKVVVDLQAER
jgi:threonine dehydrogenase-like Zn-dependent dehydrogenase